MAASMEMSLATFLRLAARRLRRRAVLAGQCKASGHTPGPWAVGPVLTDARRDSPTRLI